MSSARSGHMLSGAGSCGDRAARWESLTAHSHRAPWPPARHQWSPCCTCICGLGSSPYVAMSPPPRVSRYPGPQSTTSRAPEAHGTRALPRSLATQRLPWSCHVPGAAAGRDAVPCPQPRPRSPAPGCPTLTGRGSCWEGSVCGRGASGRRGAGSRQSAAGPAPRSRASNGKRLLSVTVNQIGEIRGLFA